jgi:hypothetical protein
MLSLLVLLLPMAWAAPMPAVSTASVSNAVGQTITLGRLGRYNPGPFRSGDPRAAEIVAHDPASQRMFVVNSFTSSVDIVSIATPTAPTLVSSISISQTFGLGTAANSVAVSNGVVAVAVEANPKTSPGLVAFFDTNGALLNQLNVGPLPDMLTFTPDGRSVLTANEGEPNSYGQPTSLDPEGSVSIIDVSGGIAGLTQANVRTVGFTDFNAGGPRNGQLSPQIRIFGPGASVAQDLEPEYIALSADSTTAYVTLQENNAVAIIDVVAGTVTALVPLGFKDHNQPGNALDPSDRDGPGGATAINIVNQPVFGIYQPDGIASYQVGGQTFLITANEGDARDYTGFSEEIRAGATGYVLDPTTFPNASTLKQNANLGRLTVTNATGDSDGDGDFDQINAFGARSFSIWNGTTGALVFDSGDDMERRTAALYPANFNANSTADALDNRSDDKGPEPEAVTIGTFSGKTYAFVGLERIGGVMVYDVSTPTAPTFVQYINPRNFPSNYPSGTPGNTTTPDDLGPEGLTLVMAANSPTGKPLLLVANEVSGSVSIYEITVPPAPTATPAPPTATPAPPTATPAPTTTPTPAQQRIFLPVVSR